MAVFKNMISKIYFKLSLALWNSSMFENENKSESYELISVRECLRALSTWGGRPFNDPEFVL